MTDIKSIQGGGNVELTNDLLTITAEINAYKRVAGEAIFEIGRRLTHVKENDLAHGEFGKWLESVGFNDRMARKFMKIADELDKERTTSSDLGLEALYQIATLPESERDRTHTTSKGEEKKPDEMTVKELREVKRQLKEEQQEKEAAQSQLASARQSEQIAVDKAEMAEERAERKPEPEVETEYIETVPDDYEQLRRENEEFRSKYGTEGRRKVDNESREGFYREFADDLEYIVNKYGGLAIEGHKVVEYAERDGELGGKVNRFSDFWNRFSKATYKDETIIEMESV